MAKETPVWRRMATLSYAALRAAVRRSGIADLRRGSTTLAGWIAPRMRHWIFKLSGTGRRFPAIVHGHKVYLPDPPPADMLTGKYEEEVTCALESILHAGMTFIDVGAHVGYYTLLAARLVRPTGKVYAFEADPANFALLVKNVELYGCRNIAAVQGAVSNTAGSVKLFLGEAHTGMHSL